jgi:hypothetical protein
VAEIWRDCPVGRSNIRHVGLAPNCPGQRYYARKRDLGKVKNESGGQPGMALTRRISNLLQPKLKAIKGVEEIEFYHSAPFYLSYLKIAYI